MDTDAWIGGYDGTPESGTALSWAATTAFQTGGTVIATPLQGSVGQPQRDRLARVVVGSTSQDVRYHTTARSRSSAETEHRSRDMEVLDE